MLYYSNKFENFICPRCDYELREIEDGAISYFECGNCNLMFDINGGITSEEKERENYNMIINYIKQEVVKAIQDKNLNHYLEKGYDNWHNFLSDFYIDEYYDVAIHSFTEEQLEEIWENSHK